MGIYSARRYKKYDVRGLTQPYLCLKCKREHYGGKIYEENFDNAYFEDER